MPRIPKNTIENNFTKGLITENTTLNFPENACTDALNVVFSETGRVTRRGEIDIESGYTLFTSAVNASQEKQSATATFIWSNVTGAGNKKWLVYQTGGYIYFYDISSSTNVSGNRLALSINMTTYTTGLTALGPTIFPCQFAQGFNSLIITNRFMATLVVTYEADALSIQQVDIRFRDFAGLDYSAGSAFESPFFRPTATEANLADGSSSYTSDGKIHYYNLLNQSYWAPLALSSWDSAFTTMPANTDQVAFYRKSPTVIFDSARVGPSSQGVSIAPKGHFILKLSDTTPRVSAMAREGFTCNLLNGSTSLDPLTQEPLSRPGACAFFAGRAWYADMLKVYSSSTTSKGYGTWIFFSQVIETKAQYGKCYQENDPTSEEYYDVLDTDGGAIVIPEIARITKMWAYQDTLVVFATNGIWLIRGGPQGFSPYDYKVRQLSSLGTQCPQSFVDVNGLPYFWSDEGICRLVYNTQFDTFEVQNLTNTTIRSFITDIPQVNQKLAQGAYDKVNEVIYWVYHDESSDLSPDGSGNYPGSFYTKCLCLNLRSGAFYPFEFARAPAQEGSGTEYTPFIRGVVYVDDAVGSSASVIKFPALKTNTSVQHFFAQLTNSTYYDWSTFDSAVVDGAQANFTSYFTSGYRIHGDAMRYVQPNYVTVLLEQQEDASCYMQGIFDYATSGTSGRYSSLQQIYNSALQDRNTNSRKLKVRGKGRSVQFKFTSEDGKPFTIIGWAVFETQNAAP